MDLAVEVTKRILEEYNSVLDKAGISINFIIKLLQLCLSSTYFRYKVECYKLICGTVMGSPVSTVVANIVLEEIESRAQITSPVNQTLLKGYIDGLCTVPEDKMEDMLTHVNPVYDSNQFSCKQETDTVNS